MGEDEQGISFDAILTAISERYSISIRTICGSFRHGGLTFGQIELLYIQSEERFFKGYELVLRALGVQIKDKKTKGKQKTKYTDKQFKPEDEYAKLTPKQREDLSNKMKQQHMSQVARLWSGQG